MLNFKLGVLQSQPMEVSLQYSKASLLHTAAGKSRFVDVDVLHLFKKTEKKSDVLRLQSSRIWLKYFITRLLQMMCMYNRKKKI